jgi:DNA-binding beta-propeller fold protein YncE
MTRSCLHLALLVAMALTGTETVLAETVIRLRPLATATRHLEEGEMVRPRAVAYDRQADEIWVTDTQNDLLGVFKPNGTPIFATGGGGMLREPWRIAVDPWGDLWVLDVDRTRVVHLDWRGSPFATPVLEGLPEEPAIGAIAIDEEGNLYIGEDNEGRIHVFDRSLQPWFRFGSRGTDEGQFSSIADIEVVGEWVAVVDAIGTAVQLFNRRGEYVRGWGEHALGAENFSLPQGITIDSKERVIVVDALRQEIKFFDIRGKFLGRFGGYGSGPGQVAYPSDVTLDASDRLYVVEKGNGRVHVFAIEEMEAPAPKPRLPRRRSSSRRR